MRVGEARSLVADTSPRHKRSSAAAHHNKTLRAAEERMLKLEPMLARLLVPVLERAGEIAARNFVALATDHAMPLTAAVEVQSNSAMVCVKPRPGEAEAIHDDDGYPPENLHVTLVYLGEIDGPLDRLVEALAGVAGRHAPLAGTVGGYGQFKTPGGPVGILLPDVPGLVELRVAVTLALVEAEIAYAREHGFEAHITVDPDAEPDELAKMLDVAGAPLSFDELLLVRGDTEVYRLPFTGRPPLTAAGKGEGEFCLPNELNKVTKPVRDKVVSTVGQAALEPLGLSFDVTNPAFQKVVGQAGKQITEISKTTQKDVMKAVKRSYDKGLSIPDAAAEIQNAMTDAALTRATMISRTELAGAVNGASLASMEVVNDELGGGEGGAAAYLKEWLTAPGAQNPRHETYEGLDGQSVHMDEPFDVGGEPVMYPGDPDGDPGETINCRCAMNYLDAQGNESDADIEASAQPLPCEAHDHLVELEGGSGPELAEKAGLAAGPLFVVAATPPPAWSAPAPSELLNIDCAAAAPRVGVAPKPFSPERATGPEHNALERGTYRIDDLPPYARMPVVSLTPAEAEAQLKKLKVLRHSLLYRSRQQLDAKKREDLERRAASTQERMKELDARARGAQPPAPPVPEPPKVELVPPPTLYDIRDLPPYAREEVSAVADPTGQRKKLVALRSSLKQRARTARSSNAHDKVERYMRRVDAVTARIDELDKLIKASAKTTGVSAVGHGNVMSTLRTPIEGSGPGPQAASRAMSVLSKVFDGHFGVAKNDTFDKVAFENTTRHNYGFWYPLEGKINLNGMRATWEGRGASREGTFWHEFGHFTDYRQIKVAGKSFFQPASETNSPPPFLRKVLVSIYDSDTYKRLDRSDTKPAYMVNRKHREYLMEPRELYARAFNQYVETRASLMHQRGLIDLTGEEHDALSRAMSATMARSTDSYGTQWDQQDFKGIYSEMDAFAKSQGWVTDTVPYSLG